MTLSLIQAATLAKDSYTNTATHQLPEYGIQLHIDPILNAMTITGTNQWRDMRYNIESEFITVQDGLQVHKGFQKLMMQILRMPIVLQNIKYFVGHSLGGSIAQLLALQFKSFGSYAYSFGAPRVFNQPIVQSNLCRVSSRLDPITYLPFAFTGYRHPKAGHEIEFKFIGHSMQKYWQSCVNK